MPDEEEEDYGFGSEDEPSSDMEMDDSTEYGFDPAEDIDISSRRVSHDACRDVPRKTRSFAARLSGSVQQSWLDVLPVLRSKHDVGLCKTCKPPLCCLLEVSRVSVVNHEVLVRAGCLRGADRAANAGATGTGCAVSHLRAWYLRWRGCTGPAALQVVRAVHATMLRVHARLMATSDT